MRILEANKHSNEWFAASIGMFDGVHCGHKSLIDRLRREAEAQHLIPAVITFRTHPANVLRPEHGVEMLMTLDQRLKALSDAGVNNVILMDFDQKLASLSAKEFMELLVKEYGVRLLLIGFNHRFGHNRSESFNDYARYGKELGIQVVQGEEMTSAGMAVSSSQVRQLLSKGWVETATRMLGSYFTIKGTVVHGFGNGRKIGFPTANVGELPEHQFIPAIGVYATIVWLDGMRYHGMANIGTRPTFNNGGLSVEVHILDFDQDIYGKQIEVQFVKMIRPEVKFNSVADLIAQLKKDKASIAALIK